MPMNHKLKDMENIKIDRNKRIMLLQWLKRGYIDGVQLSNLYDGIKYQDWSDEEIEAELVRIIKADTEGENCALIRRLGRCCHEGWRPPHNPFGDDDECNCECVLTT